MEISDQDEEEGEIFDLGDLEDDLEEAREVRDEVLASRSATPDPPMRVRTLSL